MSFVRFSRASFTLIELLIVIAIVAVLSVVVIIALNPVEILKQGRDSNRLAELNSIDRAVGILAVYVPTPYMGDQNTIYVSLPDPTLTGLPGSTTSTCLSLGLPTPPPGWSYRCAAPTSFKKVNGQGWIPIDFTQIKGTGSPLTNLPADPTNTTSSSNYYIYVPGTGGQYATAALLESEKYLKANAAKDGGTDPGRFERGNNLSLSAKASGLMGYWKMDEGGGTTADDSSGNNLSGTIGTTGSNMPTFSVAKIGQGLSFVGDSFLGDVGFVEVGVNALFNVSGTDPYALEFWVRPQVVAGSGVLNSPLVQRGVSTAGYGFEIVGGTGVNAGKLRFGHGVGGTMFSTTVLVPGQWYHVVGVHEGGNVGRIYVNGALDKAGTVITNPSTGNNFYLGTDENASTGLTGALDEVRMYRRGLTAAEARAFYNATK